MEDLFQLLGLALPDTPTLFRVKVACLGIGGIGAGALLMASGLDGMVLHGAAIAACGVAAGGLAIRDLIREARRRKARRIEERLRREDETRRDRDRELRQEACDGHDWRLDEQALDHDAWRWHCPKCGAVRDREPRS